MAAIYQILMALGLNTTLAIVIAIVIPCMIIFLLIQAVAGISTYIERKVAADIQRRIGPNKCNVGALLGEFARVTVANGKSEKAGITGKLMAMALTPAVPLLDIVDKLAARFAPGILIFLADGIKLIMKEDIIPDAVDKPMFKLAPTIVLVSAFGACAALPFSDAWYVADFNTGVLYIAAITSMEVLGILMAGWASNNKWALLGGMRSAAQIVSYEIPVGLALVTGAMIAGSLSLQDMCIDQFGFHPNDTMMTHGWFWQWNLFHPAMFVLAPVYFLAALAECNRTPFDIPEAESELVAGYHTEYTGMRFAFFFMAEYAMMCVTSALAVTIFLGGWSTGIGPLEHILMKTAPAVQCRGRDDQQSGFSLVRHIDPSGHVRTENLRIGPDHDVDPLDAAALPRGPDDDAVLEEADPAGHGVFLRRGRVDGAAHRHCQSYR